jgi:hypothetical protein
MSIFFGPENDNLNATKGSGLVMTNATVEVVFWGPAWNAQNEAPITAKIDAILNSNYQDGLNQEAYGNIQPARRDTRRAPYTIASKPKAKFTADDVTAMLKENFRARDTPNGTIAVSEGTADSTLYLVIPQPGSSADKSEGDNTAGKHGSRTYNYVYATGADKTSHQLKYNYAWVANPTGGSTDLLTYITSHEIVEALTDPHPVGDVGVTLPGGPGDHEIADGTPALGYGYRLTVPSPNNTSTDVYVSPYWSEKDHSYVVPTAPFADGAQVNFRVDEHNGGQHHILVVNDGHTGHDDQFVVDYVAAAAAGASDQIRVTVSRSVAQGQGAPQTVDQVYTFDRTNFPWDNPPGHANVEKVQVLLGGGTNTVNVERTGEHVPVKVEAAVSPSTNTVSLSGTAHDLDNVRSEVDVSGPCTITLFDQNTQTARTLTLSSTAQEGKVVGAGNRVLLKYVPATNATGTPANGATGLTFEGSSHAKPTVNVKSTEPKTPVTLHNHFAGGAQFDVEPSSKGHVNTLLGLLTIDGGPGKAGTVADVHDESNTAAGTTWHVTDSSLARTEGSAAPPSMIDYASVGVLNLDGAAPGSVYDLAATAAGTVTSITQKTGGATFNVGSTGSLVPVAGPLNVEGGSDADAKNAYALKFNDTGSGFVPPPPPAATALATPALPPYVPAYELDASTFKEQHIGTTITYKDMTSLETDGPSFGAAVWHVYSTPAGTPVTIGTGAGVGLATGNLIDVIPAGKDLSLIHKVSVKALTPGPPSTILVANDASPMTYVVTDSELTTAAYPLFDLKYANVKFLEIVNDAEPADAIFLEGLAGLVSVELVTNNSRA